MEDSRIALIEAGASERNPWVTIEKHEKISKLIHLLTTEDLHRVAVTDGGEIVDIVSQFRVVKYLLEKLKEEKGYHGITMTPAPKKPIECCTMDDIVIECFAKLKMEVGIPALYLTTLNKIENHRNAHNR